MCEWGLKGLALFLGAKRWFYLIRTVLFPLTNHFTVCSYQVQPNLFLVNVIHFFVVSDAFHVKKKITKTTYFNNALQKVM